MPERQLLIETTDERMKCNRIYTARKRALETADQADKRRKCNKVCTANKRSSETPDKADLTSTSPNHSPYQSFFNPQCLQSNSITLCAWSY